MLPYLVSATTVDTLPKILSTQGWELVENWPWEVPLPGSGSPLCGDNKGIKGLNTKHLAIVYEAMRSEQRPLRFKRVVGMQGNSAGLPMQASSSGSIGESRPNGTRRGGSEETDTNPRSAKRLRLMGD